ncbi:MAG: nucleic acid-binding protein [Spirochaetales bacterium]|nr:nucleic acid-binding protein [Spirochaetales bacterium]
MMHEVFEKLRDLQDVLSKKFDIDRDMKEIPKILTTKTELLNRLKKSYIEKNDDLQRKKERIKEIRHKMQEAERNREHSEQQMDVIKTQREYEALDKEIKIAKEKEEDSRKLLQKEEKNLEELAAQLEREENLIKKQEEEIKNENNRIKHELKEKGKLLKTLEKEEEKITPGLDEEILFKFERIIKSKAGVGIVPIHSGICTGCHMILPAQFANEVRSGESILFCPHCSRILFFQEDEEMPGEFEPIYSSHDDEEDEVFDDE